MGRNIAIDLANNNMLLEHQLAIHLQNNHYPPVPISMVSVCIEAINAGWEDDWEKEIKLPEGVTWRGKNKAPANSIIEAHHLDEWLTYDEGYSEDEIILGNA
jgi:hypothetical protein